MSDEKEKEDENKSPKEEESDNLFEDSGFEEFRKSRKPNNDGEE